MLGRDLIGRTMFFFALGLTWCNVCSRWSPFACRINLKYHTNPDKFGDQTTSCSVAWTNGSVFWLPRIPSPPRWKLLGTNLFLAPKSMLVRWLLYGKKKARVSAMCYTIYITYSWHYITIVTPVSTLLGWFFVKSPQAFRGILRVSSVQQCHWHQPWLGMVNFYHPKKTGDDCGMVNILPCFTHIILWFYHLIACNCPQIHRKSPSWPCWRRLRL